MVNNFQQLSKFLKPESEDDFWHLQLLQRKKDLPEIGSNSKVVKNYCIRNEQHLLKKEQEIIDLCTLFKARASLRLNRRSFYKTAFKAMQNLSHVMMNKEFSHCAGSYDRACGQGNNERMKKWIIDIDDVRYGSDEAVSITSEVVDYINTLEPCCEKFWCSVPTKSGFHIISSHFNVQKFNEKYSYEIHKDNPSCLFIPDF